MRLAMLRGFKFSLVSGIRQNEISARIDGIFAVMLGKVRLRSGGGHHEGRRPAVFWLARARLRNSQAVSLRGNRQTGGVERMWNSQVIRDATAVASMIATSFINTEWDGEVSDRGKFLGGFRDPKFQPSLMNIRT